MHKSALTLARSLSAVRRIVVVVTIGGLLLTGAPAQFTPAIVVAAAEGWQDGDRVYSPRWDCYGTVCRGGSEVRWDGTTFTTDDVEFAREYGDAVREGD
jgi:hypothetical protein